MLLIAFMGGGLIKYITTFYGGKVNKVPHYILWGGGLLKYLTIFYGGRVNKVPHYILWEEG